MSDDDILTVVAAHKQGKKIQAKSTTSVEPIWLDCCDPMFWNFEKCDYRVASEPRKPRDFWLWRWKDMQDDTWRASIAPLRDCSYPREQIHVREVI